MFKCLKKVIYIVFLCSMCLLSCVQSVDTYFGKSVCCCNNHANIDYEQLVQAEQLHYSSEFSPNQEVEE